MPGSMEYSMYHLHSGGAAGADLAWERIGKELGIPLAVKHWLPNDLYTSPYQEEIREGLYKAAESLGRPKRFSGEHYVMRNWLQVYHAQAVYAISTIIPPGGLDKGFPNKSGKEVVAGGTGWAVEMAIQMGKPVYVFDQTSDSPDWWQWRPELKAFGMTTDERFYTGPKEEWDGIPLLTQKFAGIGSRNLTESGKQAIKDVYLKTLEYGNQG